MAEIPVEKKGGLSWLWILLAVILIALLVWWFMGTDDDDEADVTSTAQVEETVEPETVDETPANDTSTAGTPGAEAGTLAAILANPDAYYDEEFAGEVDVGETLTDRGFWVEQDGNRMFALIVDEPREAPVDINPGMELRLTDAEIRRTSSLSDVEGQALDADTRRIADEQSVILVVDEEDIEILSPQ
ncbi:MAG: hypothetical protein WA989_14010 [Henriciella sp.]|uniref:hypothetical protein n=1 Tax=Henriciella sp. TaxID=1968823 RepID=UPI003C7957F2